jgi:hypothetical protein
VVPRWYWWKCTEWSSVALNNPTGTVTSPNVIEPDQMERGTLVSWGGRTSVLQRGEPVAGQGVPAAGLAQRPRGVLGVPAGGPGAVAGLALGLLGGDQLGAPLGHDPVGGGLAGGRVVVDLVCGGGPLAGLVQGLGEPVQLAAGPLQRGAQPGC